MLLRGDLLFSKVKECGLSPLSLLITGQWSDKNCLLGNGVGEEEEEVGGSHLMTGQEEEEGRGEVVSVSTLLVLIGVHRKVFDK